MSDFLAKVSICLLMQISLACNSQPLSSPVNTSVQANIDDASSGHIEQKNSKARPSQDLAEESESQANEPVSVAGAFLSCNYASGQKQNSASYQIDCQLENVEYEPVEVQASFSKIADNGDKYQLEIVSFDRNEWRWVLAESPESIYFTTLLVEVVIDGQGPFMFSYELDDPLTLNLFAGFWLSGEPNNEGGDENCVEMLTQEGQNNHFIYTGLNSGEQQRLNDISCVIERNFLCKNLDSSDLVNKWRVSSLKAVFAEYARACPDGYGFRQPMTIEEVMEVNAVIDSEPPGLLAVWVPMRKNPDEMDEFQLLFLK